MVDDVLGMIIVFIIIGVVLFFVQRYVREYWCWYYKINDRLEQQKITNQLLRDIKKQLEIQNMNQIPVEQLTHSDISQSSQQSSVSKQNKPVTNKTTKKIYRCSNCGNMVNTVPCPRCNNK